MDVKATHHWKTKMAIVYHLFLTIVLVTDFYQCQEIPLNVTECKQFFVAYIDDTTEIDDPLLEFSNPYISITAGDPCDPNYFQIQDKTFVLKGNLTHYCEETKVCHFICKQGGVTTTSIFTLFIRRAATYTLKFKNEHYNAVARELSEAKMIKDLSNELYITQCSVQPSSSTSIFRIQAGPYSEWFNITNAGDGKVYATSKVDYEQLTGMKTVNIVIRASRKLPSSNIDWNASTILEVKIEDVDDNNPNFTSEVYHLNITEHNVNQTNVDLTTEPPIAAYDGDQGINDTISYSIIDEKALQFSIDESNGRIRVNQTLDREKNDFFVLHIRAREKSNTHRTATATLLVKVLDTDNNSPKFDPDSYTANIAEHSANGQVITTVNAIDADEGLFAQFTYELKENSTVIGINGSTGVIYVKDSLQLDREKMTHIFVQVLTRAASNSSIGPNHANVTIHLIDINDNSPKFNHSASSFIFKLYNASSGKYVQKIDAYDIDSGDNAKLNYSFGICLSNVGNCDGNTCDFPFQIDSSTGNITMKALVMPCKYTALVMVCDSPKYSSGLCTSSPVTIEVLSLSSDPVFLISGAILENSAKNSIVAKLPSQCLLNTPITCQKDEHMFRVDNTSYMVVTSGIPDYETISSYNCSAHKYTSDDMIICTVIFNITVLDVNDNEPDVANYTLFQIPTDAKAGSYIGQIYANDKDQGGNQTVSFYIQESSVKDLFHLNSTTGKLHVNNPEELSRDYYQLIIVAEDEGIPPLKSLGIVLLHKHTWQNNSLPLSTTRSQQEMQSQKSTFERTISGILKVDVTIDSVVAVGKSEGSRIIITAKENGAPLSSDTLLRLVLRHYDALLSHLNGNHAETTSTMPKSNESALTAPVIALIIIACVLCIGGLVAIIVVHRQYNGHQRYKRLYENLTKHSSLYESQELKVKMEDETSDYNGSVNTQDLEMSDNNKTEALTSSMNPVYGLDPAPSPSVAEAMLSLNELSERLNEEEDVPKPDYENVPSPNMDENVSKPDYENVPSPNMDENVSKPDYENVPLPEEDKNQTETGELLSTEAHHTSSGLENVENLRSESPTPDYDQQDGPNESDNTTSEPNGIALEPDSEVAANSLKIGSEKNNDEVQEEPKPDYDKKQVRFAHQVLDPDENKMTPLKTEDEEEDGDNKAKSDFTSENKKGEKSGKRLLPPLNLDKEGTDEPKLNVSDETGWLEEEINSPIDVMTVDDKDNEFFEEEVTSL